MIHLSSTYWTASSPALPSLPVVSKHPQSVGMDIGAASSKFSCPDLVSAMLQYIVYNHDIGLRHSPNRYYYDYASTTPLPHPLSSIDICHGFKLHVP